uniref:Uncharacterized protein n=1 Tax=Avena sativa TaxID=4498 RepID=A0ACD5WWX3_AVESA
MEHGEWVRVVRGMASCASRAYKALPCNPSLYRVRAQLKKGLWRVLVRPENSKLPLVHLLPTSVSCERALARASTNKWYQSKAMALVPHDGARGARCRSPVWAIKVEANLDAQGLREAVVPADSTTVVDPKKNKTARAYLLGALAEDILLQMSSKKTASKVWASLKARFVGTDRVRTARLSTLRGDFDRLIMVDDEALDVYARKISGMVAKYENLGATLSDAEMVKKLLDTVPDALYMAVADIEQFCNVETVCFDEVLGRLKAF